MNVNSIFRNEYEFLQKMNHRTNLQNTHLGPDLLEVINKPEPNSKIARDIHFRVKAYEKGRETLCSKDE